MHITLEKTKSQSTSKTSVCNVMSTSVSRYHEFDYWFDWCWEILPGQLGNKLLIQWWLASGFWALEKCDECTRKEGVTSTFTWLMFIMQKKQSPGRYFPPSFPHVSLAPKNPLSLPFEMPATQAKWCQSICLSFPLFKIYQAIWIFCWLELKYKFLHHWMSFYYWRTKTEKMVTEKGNIKSGTMGQ